MSGAPRRRSLALLAGLLAAVSLLSAAPAVLGNHTPSQEGKTWSLSTTTINVPMRATVSLPTPCRAASDRVDHAAEPSSGTLCSVSSTIASTTDAGIWGLRPRPGATTPTPAAPDSMNRSRQRRTVS